MVLNLKSKPSKEKVPKPKKEPKPGKKMNPLKKEKPVKQKKIKAADPKKGAVVNPKEPKQGKVKTPNLFKKPKSLKKDEDVKAYNASPASGQAPRAAEQKKKNLYKDLLINGVLVCIILALSLALLLVLLLSGKDKRNVCETPECISLSQQLLNWRDESVDPCKDFHQYACGKYNEHVAVQASSLTKQSHIINGLIRDYLIKNKKTSSASENAMLQLFAKCQEHRNITNGVQAENLQKLAEQVKSHVGHWNDANININKALPNIVTKFGEKGNILDFGLFSVATLTGAELIIFGSQYKLPHQDTMKMIINEALKFAPSDNDLNDIFSFKEELDRYFKKEMNDGIEYNKLKTLIPSIEFDQIIKSTFKSPETAWPKVESKIQVNKVFERGAKLEDLIKGKRKDLGNFLIFKFLETLFNDLNVKNQCDSMVTKLLPLASYRVFIRNHFDKESMEDVAEMVENTKDVFIEMIEDSEWLDDKTKKNAIKKAKAMKTIVGYPKEFEKAGAFDEIFNFEIKSSDFYSEIIYKTRIYSVQQLTSFIASETTLNPVLVQFTTNAFYARYENSIIVLAPIIDDPLFHHSFPEYAKIAGVGFIISHEIGHGFDNGGRLFDEKGNPKNWWTEKDMKEYEKRMMCLVEQYEKYDDPTFGKNLNGSLTLGEMGADQISADVSWRSFKKLDIDEEPRLIGFEDYDIEKLYFQIGALNWCSPRPSSSLQQQLADEHPVSSFRVNGVLANMKQFADTYDCPAGSPMNPKKKSFQGYPVNQNAWVREQKPINTDPKSIYQLSAFSELKRVYKKPILKMVLNLKSKPSKEKVPKPKKEAKPGKKLNPLKKENPVKQKKIKAADPKKGAAVKPKDPKQEKVKTPNLFKKSKMLKKDEDVKVYNASPAPGQAAREPEQKKKKSYKSLLIHGVLVLIILALSLALLLVLLLSGKDKRNVCETPECISLSQQLLNWRDESVDPCKDFFQYSCGKYNEHVAVQASSLTRHSTILNGLIREYLLKNKTTSSVSENAMLQMFAKCQEYRNITNGVRAENLQNLAKQVESYVGNWNDANFDITKALANTVTKFGVEGRFLDFGLFSLATATGAELFLIRSKYELPDQDTMKKILNKTLHITPSPSDDDLKNILSFKEEWDKLFIKESDGPAQYQSVKNVIPSIEFDKIIKSTLRSAETAWPKIESKIQVDKLFETHGAKMDSLIKHNKENLRRFLIFKFLQTSFNVLDSKHDCHSIVTSLLPLASYRVFIRNHFDKENLEDVAEMVENTKDVFIEMIEDSKWLDDKTKKNAIKKAKAMKTVVGYPKEFEKAGAFDEIFNLEIKPSDSYSQIIYKTRIYSVQQLTSFIASETTLNPTLLHFTTNALYATNANSIVVLAPIIDDPLFHHSFPEYAKIAGVGFIISHEIGHGFDNGGRMFDENGKQKMWWTEKDVKEYEKRMMCLVEQYEKYDDPTFGKNLNGSLTLDEMGADQISADISWRSFKKLDLEEEPRLVGFEDYDIEKLYFQIGALNWCSPRPTKSLQEQLADDHPIHSFRVNGVFSNMKQFADTYHCPAGSPMNPKTKCEMF